MEGSAPRRRVAAAFGIAALLVPAVPLLVVYFADRNQSPSPDGIRAFMLIFPTVAAAVLVYVAFVFAAPGLKEGTRWRHGLAIPVSVLAAVIVLIVAFLTLNTRNYFPPGS